MTFSANFSLVLPEVVLAIAALVLLVAGAFRGKVGAIFTLAAVASLVAAAATSVLGPKGVAFGGVYDVWNAAGKSAITSYAIVTTAAAPSTAAYHDRMPLVLEESQFDDWMRGPSELAADMMKPYGGEIEIWEVDAAVGNVRNNRPGLMEPVA